MGLIIHQEKISEENGKKLEELCPFSAISYENGNLEISCSHVSAGKEGKEVL